MPSFNKITSALLLSSLLSACYSEPGIISPAAPAAAAGNSAPAIPVAIHDNYKPAARYAYALAEELPTEPAEDASTWDFMRDKYQTNVDSYNQEGAALTESTNAYPNFDTLEEWAAQIYDQVGTKVKFVDVENNRQGVFSLKWWAGVDNIPAFDSANGPWELVVETGAEGQYLTKLAIVQPWKQGNTYVLGNIVKHNIDGEDHYFEAQWWTNGGTAENPEQPALPGLGNDGNPWLKIDPPSDTELAKPNFEDELGKPPTCEGDSCTDATLPDNTPTILPVLPHLPDGGAEPKPPTEPPVLEQDGLPAEGYAFLRELTAAQWDWFFPLRNGKCEPQGGAFNKAPYACDESKQQDIYSLENFKKAVIAYNQWAQANGYKQFLNEGSTSQQATEFAAFWAKSARETSGSWENAPAPWIVDDADAGTVWKGALYWLEENGFTTEADGSSKVIGYVDPTSSYAPVAGRSYHGRGIIQLSWNYNYGLFSQWLFDNGIYPEIITAKTTLLDNPALVATNAEISYLSGIWFWMTPQGAKPAAQDVILGAVSNVSQTSQELGLPQRNDNGEIPTVEGETQDQAVMAYRLGTVINIVNGGLECNGAASWHQGPVQRVSYYNAFAQYLNAQLNGVTIPVVDAAKNVWTQKVTDQSSDQLKTATCYAQKAYYTW